RLAALRGDADLGLGAALALEAEAEAELPVRGDDGVEAQPAGARQGDGGARRAARGDARAQRGVARRLEGTLDAVAGDDADRVDRDRDLLALHGDDATEGEQQVVLAALDLRGGQLEVVVAEAAILEAERLDLGVVDVRRQRVGAEGLEAD